jgi:hypothetical protein
MRLLEESMAMLLEKLEFDSVNQEQLKYIKVQFHAILSAACVSRSQFFFGALRAQANEKKKCDFYGRKHCATRMQLPLSATDCN